jgi:hypothetical protein
MVSCPRLSTSRITQRRSFRDSPALYHDMKPTKVFDSYWKFAVERQALFYKRLSEAPGTWTTNPILQVYRFTNAYRAADRVSQYLIREVQYGNNRSQEPQEVFYRTLLFKIFNRIETWEALEDAIGFITWEDGELQKIASTFDLLVKRGNRIYSSAYIMPSPRFGHPRKYANHLALLEQMMSDRLPEQIQQANSLRGVYERLARYPGLGPFLAFQYAIDLNYSSMLTFTEDQFVVAGPGARDGISKCFSDFEDYTPEYIIQWTTERQELEFDRLGLHFETLFGRRLQLIDCQNLFCEIAKYARVAHPEIAGIANRRKIKRSYSPNPRSLLPLIFPPRWGLRVPQAFGEITERQGRLF